MVEQVASSVDVCEVAHKPLGLEGPGVHAPDVGHGDGRCDELGELVGTAPAGLAVHACATAVEAVINGGVGFWSRVLLAVGVLVAVFISVPIGAVFMALAMLLLSQ